MTDSVARLEETLTAQLRVTQAIASLAERERGALEEDDLAALAGIVREKESCVAELAVMEAACNMAAVEWAREQNLAGESTSFDQIVHHMDRGTARQLKALRDGMRAHLDYARSLGAGNRALLHAALDRNAALCSFLLGLTSGGSGYTASGARHSHAANHLMEWSG